MNGTSTCIHALTGVDVLAMVDDWLDDWLIGVDEFWPQLPFTSFIAGKTTVNDWFLDIVFSFPRK